MLATGSVEDFINLWFGVPKAILCSKRHGDTEDTLEHLWPVVVWDAWTVCHGIFLGHNWLGAPFPPGHRRAKLKDKEIMGGHLFPHIQVGADTEYLCNHLGLPHWQAVKPCGCCNCDNLYVKMPRQDEDQGEDQDEDEDEDDDEDLVPSENMFGDFRAGWAAYPSAMRARTYRGSAPFPRRTSLSRPAREVLLGNEGRAPERR